MMKVLAGVDLITSRRKRKNYRMAVGDRKKNHNFASERAASGVVRSSRYDCPLLS